MPIEASSGTLDVENAKLRASEIIATASVGIGTTDSNQSYPLQIFKETGPDIRIQEGATSSSAARLYSNNSNLYIQTGTNFTSGSSGDIAFQTMGGQATHMIVKSDGKVGVGTGSPGSKLHVYDGTAASLIVEGGNNTIGTDTAQIILRNQLARRAGLEFQDDSDNSQIWHIGRRYASGGASTKLSFSNVNNDEVMTITNAGNVGIGTGSPQHLFHMYHANDSILRVETDTGQAQLLLRAGATSRRACRIDFSRADTGAQYAYIIGDYQQNATDDLTLGTSGGGRIMTLTQGGRAGIGTVNPYSNFHVYTAGGGPSSTDCLVLGDPNGSAAVNLRLGAETNYSWIQSHEGSDLRLNPVGNTIKYGSGGTTLSDDRIKDNEEYIRDATQTLLKLKPQIYNKHLIWDLSSEDASNVNTTRESGLITQDVWYDTPELRHLVHLGREAHPSEIKPYTDDDPQNDPDYSTWGNEPSSLNYTGLIPYLIKSNQELHTEIQTLKSRIEVLENP